jgi:hypothetical protein
VISTPEPCPLDIYKGVLQAKIDGTDWEACPYAKKITVAFIEGNNYDLEAGILIRGLTIIIPDGVGRFKVTDHDSRSDTTATVYWSELDSDVYRAKYSPNPYKLEEYVEVTHFDSINGRITGTFAFTVYRRASDGLENYPDSLVITEGYFDTYFIE